MTVAYYMSYTTMKGLCERGSKIVYTRMYPCRTNVHDKENVRGYCVYILYGEREICVNELM